jgi:galactofuranose transport system ATP-binding protein
MASSTQAPRLAARDIVKRFHANVALDGVDFDLRRGEVHGLVGENGAGKSTLIKILTGVQPPDAGEIVYEGRKVTFASPSEAQRAGVTAIYQEINLAPNLSAAENIFIGNEPLTRLRTVDWRRMREEAKALLDRYGIDIDFRPPVGELGLAAQQMVAIVRALSQNGQTIVMDEPTSSLTHREVDRLLDTVGQIAATGASVIYISHRLDELFRVAHRVTVLRDGRRILTEATTSLTRAGLVEAMLGRADIRQLDAVRNARPAVEREGALEVEGLSSAPRVADASLAIKAGEIVGLAGLQGSGRTETMRTIFGADAKLAGAVRIDGAPFNAQSPRLALARGLGYLPEDRKADGIIPGLSLRENLTLILLPRLSRLGIVSHARETALVDEFIRRLGVRAANADIPIRHLSGGNQQKVLIARLLCADPKYLLLDDPMRGIDIGAKSEIERLIVELSGMGLGVLMTSSELEEVIGVSDRIVVMRDGATRGDIARDQASFETVAASIASERAEPAQ